MAGDRTVYVRLKADISDFQRGMVSAGASASAFTTRLGEADQRLAGMTQSILALGPALVPLGAAAVPAMAGLALQLGLAAGAAGVAVLAFQGVGDSIKALDAARLNPTAKNIEKLNETMQKLGPAGQDFAVAMSDLEPKLKRLRSTAEAGLFPGLTEGIDDAMTQFPIANRMVSTFATTLGDLAAQAGKSLTTPGWTDFFDYIDRTARPVLSEMGQTFGNLIQGVANLMMDLDPLSRSFSSGLLDMSQAFNQWTQSVQGTQGFADFIDYVQESGPKALDAIGSIASALVAIVDAAAPVGSVMLPVIADLADLFGSLADSPIGPVLVSAAAAIGVLGRSMALLEAVGLKGGKGGFLDKNYVQPAKGLTTAFREAKVASAELVAAEKTAAAESIAINDRRMNAANKAAGMQFAMVPAKDKRAGVGEYVRAQKEAESAARKSAETVSNAALKVQQAEATKRAAMNETFKTIGKAGVVAAGLAVATSGVADKMGLSNAATGAMTGMIAGPWGAAVGGGIGLAMDFAAANNDIEDAVKRSGAAVDGASRDFQAAQAAIDATRQATSDYQKSLNQGSKGLQLFDPSTWFDVKDKFRTISEMWTHSGEDAQKASMVQQKSIDATAKVVAGFAGDQGLGKIDPKNFILLGAAADQMRPKFAAAGVDMDQLASQIKQGGVNGAMATAQYAALLGTWQAMDQTASTSAGKSTALGRALRDIGDAATDAKDPVKALNDTLDALFAPKMNQAAAVDAWAQSLHDLRKNIKGSAIDTNIQSEAARKNRAAVRDSAGALLDKIKADAAAGVSGDKLVGSLTKGRQAIINAGVAAGISRKDMKEYINTLGLTPRNLTTMITADGDLTAKQRIEALAAAYGKTPTQIETLVGEAGAHPTAAKIRDLAKQFGLLPAQVRAILDAQDNASSKVATAHTALRDFERNYKAYLNADDKSSPKAQAARAAAEKFANKYLAALGANDKATGPLSAAQRKAIAFVRRYAATLGADDHASGAIRGALSLARQFAAIRATATLTTNRITHYSTTGSPSRNAPAMAPNRTPKGYKSERGNLVEHGRIRRFEDGGYGSDGRYYSRSPQMVAGGANVLWGEKSTGWEAYISGMPSERDRNIDILSMAADRLGMSVVENARGRITDTYAKGGHKGPTSYQKAVKAFDLEGGQTAKQVQHEFHTYAKHLRGITHLFWQLEHAAMKVAKQYNDQEKQLQRVNEKAKNLRAGARDSFNGDIFGNGVAGLNLQLRADRNDSEKMTKALARLRRKGLGGGLAAALGASGDLNTAQQLAQMTPSQIAAESRLYASRSRAQRNLGQQAVDTAGYTRQIKNLSASLHKLDHTLNELEHRVENGVRRGTSDRNRKTHQRRRANR